MTATCLAGKSFGIQPVRGDNTPMACVFIGIGSNLGDRRRHVRLACRRLAKLPGTQLVGQSDVYETDPVGPVPQDPYLNAAVQVETRLDPHELLEHLAQIERASGRTPADQRVKWGPRTLDLDILLYADQVISSDELVIPHPLMHDRWFVLKPLCDLNPDAVHPILEMTVSDLLRYLENSRSPAEPSESGER